MTLRVWNDRWRTFGDATALALGLNLWVTMDLLPALAVGAFTSVPTAVILLAPIFVLAWGVARRNEVILLLAFPSTLLVPIAMTPAMASSHFYGPIRFLIVGLGLMAFLFGASTLTSFREAPEPHHSRALKSASAPLPPRWKRRFRIYAELALASVIFPLALLYRINFDAEGARAMAENYTGRVVTFTTLLNVLALAMWLLLFSRFILEPLKQHRTGDRSLERDLASLRRRANPHKPNLLFYLGGFFTILLMALWFLWRG